jgi:hypothetical protein
MSRDAHQRIKPVSRKSRQRNSDVELRLRREIRKSRRPGAVSEVGRRDSCAGHASRLRFINMVINTI